MHWTDSAVVLSVRRHGEHSAIVSALTAKHGRHAGLVRGAFGKSKRGILQPGNAIQASWRARVAENLGTLDVELVRPWSAYVLDDPLRLAALNAACAVADAALPEREAHQPVYDGFLVFLSSLEKEDSWPQVYVRWELGLLGELGFGLSLDRCASTGQRENLVYVSPKSGRAVSAEAGNPYRDRLLPLPAFLSDRRSDVNGDSTFQEVMDGLRLCGFFLERHVFANRRHGEPQARQRLVELLATHMANAD